MKILVLQHLDVEHPGVFRDFLKEDGLEWTTVELDQGDKIPDIAGFDLMIVMGGPQDVWETDRFPWLIDEIAAIRAHVVDARKPYLGICLGHQLLAAAIGGDVTKGDRAEVGVMEIEWSENAASDPVVGKLPDPLNVLQWHGAEVSRLPAGAIALASSPACRIQAIRYGDCAYGFQFHVEATETTVPDWAAIPVYAASLEATLGKGAVEKLEADVAQNLPAFNQATRTLYDAFMHVTRMKTQAR